MNLAEAIEEWRKDPEFAKRYDAGKWRFVLVRRLIKLAREQGMNLDELAKKAKLPKSKVYRIVDANFEGLWDAIAQIADTLGVEAHIVLQPEEGDK